MSELVTNAFRTSASDCSGLERAQVGLRSLSWFAAYTTSRHEKRIAQHLETRQIEHFLPLYSVSRKWKDGSKVILDLPLFPNYVFVRTSRCKRVKVLEIPGVLCLAGARSEPAPVPDIYVHDLKEALRLKKIEPHPYLVVGEKVRITNGAMAGAEGILVRKKNDLRVVITLEMMFQSISLEVDASDLEAVTPTRLPLAHMPAATHPASAARIPKLTA